MTSPPPAKTEDEDKLSKKLPPVHVAAQVIGTLSVAFAASYLGPYGTVTGLACGTLLSTTIPVLFEHVTTTSARRARQRVQHYRSRGMTPEMAKLAATSELQRARSPQRRKRLYLWTGITSALVLACSLLVLTVAEAAAGKPASAIVQGKAGHGTTLGGGGPASQVPKPNDDTPASSPTTVVTPLPSATTVLPVTVSPTASTSPSLTPSPSLSPAASTTPTAGSTPSTTNSPADASPTAPSGVIPTNQTIPTSPTTEGQ